MPYCKNQGIKLLIIILFTAALVSVISQKAWASPDVHVTDIQTPSSLIAFQDSIVTAEMVNYGSAGIFSSSVYIDGSLEGTWQIYMGENSGARVSFLIRGLPAGYHVITICANTCLSKGWTWINAPDALPDLELNNIYDPTSLVGKEQTSITAKVSNIGSAGTGAFNIDMFVDGLFTNRCVVSDLPAQYYAECTVTFPLGLTGGVTHSIRFVADPYNRVSESNEGNNEMTKTWTWTGTPDFEVSDIYDPTSLNAFDPTTITAKISNIGNAGAVFGDVTVFVDGSLAGVWPGTYLPGKSYREFLVTFNGWFPAGAHSVKFVVDYNNTVSESNEGNNERTESWTWTGAPDLWLNDIYDPTSLGTGFDTSIGAKIVNIGNAGTAPFYTAVFLDGSYAGSCRISYLPSNYYTECWIAFYGGLDLGAHSLRFVADYYNTVAESNEGNNERTESWTWTGTAELEMSDIYNPTSLVAGEDTTITGKITNIGYGNAGPFSVGMYIDWEYMGSGYFSEGLPAGYIGEISATVYGGLPAGQHEILFVVDFFDFTVPEANEIDNNYRIEYFTWTDLSSCAPQVGSGLGVLNDSKPHIDACYDNTSGVYYYLKDVSRRANETQHSHNGQMSPDAAIDTKYYNKGFMNDTDNKWNDANQKSGVDAHVYAGQVYDYFLSKFGLNSFDGSGNSMLSVVEDSSCADNASWVPDMGSVYYCVESKYLPVSSALDVVAHEWGHALTERAGAGLIYNRESGALNEAFSDWIGATIEYSYNKDNWNWTIGERISYTLRDLSNPSAYDQPDTYKGVNWYPIEDCIPTRYNDYCGVHTNSGVPNKMFYLLSQGGIHNGVTVTGIGIEKAIKIAYTANTNAKDADGNPLYWYPNVTFVRACEGMRNAAEFLYGTNSQETKSLVNAWLAVGVDCQPIPAQYSLVVTKTGAGSGTIISSPSGINCGIDCAENYNIGTIVTLAAAPDSGSIFSGWSGACAGTGTCTITMDANKSVSAVFGTPTLPSTPLQSGGQGTGTINQGTSNAPGLKTSPGIQIAPGLRKR